MGPEDRDLILSSMELALGYPSRDPNLTKVSGQKHVPSFLGEQATWDAFKEALEALGASFHLVPGMEEARRCIAEIMTSNEVKKAAIWREPSLDPLALPQLLEDNGVLFNPPRMGEKEFRQWCADCDIGITSSEAVLVESGTIILFSGPGKERSTSLLPPIHLAIVSAGRRIDSVLDLPTLLRSYMLDNKGRLPNAIYLITGPSRTADIALQLVLGAHGPRALHIVALAI